MLIRVIGAKKEIEEETIITRIKLIATRLIRFSTNPLMPLYRIMQMKSKTKIPGLICP